jgi:glyoxylase-like metal-dependent hydrolase (beta-lactamase superfamily II)
MAEGDDGEMIGWKWSVLSDGWTSAREALLLRGGSWTKVVRCSVTAVLLESRHHGPVLFDCGYSSRFFAETKRGAGALYGALTPATVTEPTGIAGILRRRGIDPDRLEDVIVSHWHADHVGGLRDFPHAVVHANRSGWEAVRSLRGLAAVQRGVLPGLFPEDLEQRLHDVNEGDDVFGDGSLTVLELPGHAVGQIGIRFLAEDLRPVLLVADACWLSAAFRENRPPHAVTKILHDSKAYQDTLQRLHDLSRSEPELLIVPSHCPETAERIIR